MPKNVIQDIKVHNIPKGFISLCNKLKIKKESIIPFYQDLMLVLAKYRK